MKEKIYLYLLAFITVIFLFFYKYQSSVFKQQQEDVYALERVVEKLEEEKKVLTSELAEATYFSLEKNESALTYIEDVYSVRPDFLAQQVENYFYDMNGTEDNSSVPYSGMEGIMQVNKVRLLNHKWAIVDFTDGVYWGEMILEYFYTPEDNSIQVELLHSFLYTTN